MLTGALTGVVAGMLGVGGGIVIVPVLYHILPWFGIDDAVRMHLAVGTSLAIIIPTSIVSATAHFRRGAVDFALLRSWGPAVTLGVIIGALLAAPLGGQTLTMIFAAIALVVAANMFLARNGFHLADALPGRATTVLVAGLVGGVSTLMGIGGGTLSVPILTLFNYPIRKAVGTAAALGIVISIPGAAGFIVAGWDVPGLPPASIGYVNLIAAALIVPTTALSTPLGARLAHTIDAALLHRVFALFLALTSIRMISGLVI
ncbi:MAG: sulfite exporter TauE/SafE family protein [Sphingomonadales bacterium]